MSENKKIQLFKSLTPTEAFKLIKEHENDPNWIILDIRTPWEFAENHIENAKKLAIEIGRIGNVSAGTPNRHPILKFCLNRILKIRAAAHQSPNEMCSVRAVTMP